MSVCVCECVCFTSSFRFQGDDTMTGDGGEYLRVEDLRELGDDSLPGQYLDGMNYLRYSLDRWVCWPRPIPAPVLAPPPHLFFCSRSLTASHAYGSPRRGGGGGMVEEMLSSQQVGQVPAAWTWAWAWKLMLVCVPPGSSAGQRQGQGGGACELDHRGAGQRGCVLQPSSLRVGRRTCPSRARLVPLVPQRRVSSPLLSLLHL